MLEKLSLSFIFPFLKHLEKLEFCANSTLFTIFARVWSEKTFHSSEQAGEWSAAQVLSRSLRNQVCAGRR